MIETLEDIVEQLADQMGVYGAHREDECAAPHYCCRPCWTAHLRSRIEQAVEVERKLACVKEPDHARS